MPAMTLEELFRFYRAESQDDLAKRIGVSQGAVSQWKAAGEIPVFRQLAIEDLTQGRLRADRKALYQKLAAG